jgi:hypothetical protein
MAYEIPGATVSLPAAADLSANQYFAVNVNSSGQAAAIGGQGAIAIGVLQNKPAAAGHAASVMCNGVTKMVAAGTVASGAVVTTSANGRAETAASGDFPVGRALVGGAAGEYITVALSPSSVPLA